MGKKSTQKVKLVDDASWHAKKLRIWNLVLKRDEAMRVFFNEDENPLDGDQEFTVGSDGKHFFNRRIRRAANDEAKTKGVFSTFDKNGRNIRTVTMQVPNSLARTPLVPLPAGYDRVFAKFAADKQIAIDAIAAEHEAQLSKIKDEKKRAAALKKLVDDKLGDQFEAAAEAMAAAINLYHELIHMRLRFEFDAFWPADQQSHKEHFLKWSDPDQSPALRKAFDKLVDAHSKKEVMDWLEEKYAGNQSFAIFGMWELNEELAAFYTRGTHAIPENVCELFDLLDQAHGVPTSGRDPTVKVHEFRRVIEERREDYHEYNKQSLTPKQYKAAFDFAKKNPPWDPAKQITFPPGLPKGTIKPNSDDLRPKFPSPVPAPSIKGRHDSPDLGAGWYPPSDQHPTPASFASRVFGAFGFGGNPRPPWKPLSPPVSSWQPKFPAPYRPSIASAPIHPTQWATYKPPAPPPFKPPSPLPPLSHPFGSQPGWARGPVFDAPKPPPLPSGPDRFNPGGHPWDPGSWNPTGIPDPPSMPWRSGNIGGGFSSPFHPSPPYEPPMDPYTGPLKRSGEPLGPSFKYPDG